MRSALLVCTALLILTIVGSLWIFIEGTQGLRQLIENHNLADRSTSSQDMAILVRCVDSWLRQVALGTTAGLAALIVVVLVSVLWWRHRWAQRHALLHAQLQEDALRLAQTQADLERQNGEVTRLATELRGAQEGLEQHVAERIATLNAAKSSLEEELARSQESGRQAIEQHDEQQKRIGQMQSRLRLVAALLDSTAEAIYALDPEGNVIFANQAAGLLAAHPVGELLGRQERDVFPSGVTSHPGNEAIETEPHDQTLWQRPDGTVCRLELSRTPMTRNGGVLGEVVVCRDITERTRHVQGLARRVAELSRSNAELEQFAYVASHDLQEPLRKIQTFGDRVKAKCADLLPPDGRDYLERMQSASARMQTLIHDLLTFSRVISASRAFIPVDVGSVVREVLGDLEVRIEQSNAVIEVGELPTLEADPLQMRQLLLNLLSNALKFQPAGQRPQVKIGARVINAGLPARSLNEPTGAVCELTITDNGIGFEEKYAEKMFAAFQRLHGRDRYEGTGVGLAVCRRITDRHGGTISAHGKPGEGATFVVRLPMRHVHPEMAP